MGFASSRKEARQLVLHGHFTVNGKKANIPSILVKAGDVVAVKESSRSSAAFKRLTAEVINVTRCYKLKAVFISLFNYAGKVYVEDILSTAVLTAADGPFALGNVKLYLNNRAALVGAGKFNIVRLAIECMNIENKNYRIEHFFSKLDELLEITAKQLCDRYDFQKTALRKQFPLLMSSLWMGCEKLGPNDMVGSVINQGTLGIGFLGLAECLIALTGKHHGESEEAQALGLRIVTYMRDRANEFSERYHHNFSVLATPAEGLSGKFTRLDRKSFGEIKGVTDKIYYTNSNHVPVYYHCSPKHKAEVEAPYHDLTRGGHIFYIEIDGDATHNPQAIMDIVDLMDKHNIGYCSVNHNRNRCLDCGYEDAQENLTVCPKCGGENIDKLQRITGYLVGTTERWNQSKLAELNDRVIHQ